MPSRHLTLPALALLAACGGAADGGDAAFTVVDSAGVQVATSTAPLWTEQTRWRLAEAPDLELGQAMAGDSAVPFAAVAGVHVLSDGTLAVHDPWAPGLFFFDDNGAYLGRGGRAGSGPGEFPTRTSWAPRSFTCGGDTVWVQVERTYAGFTAPGTYERTWQPEAFFNLASCAGDRRVGTSRVNAWRTTPGIHIDSAAVGWFDADGTMTAVLDTVQSHEAFYTCRDRGGESACGYYTMAFGRIPSVALHADAVATAFGSTIRLLDARGDGGLTLVRGPEAGRVVEDADIDRYRDFVLNPWRGSADELRQIETMLEEAAGRPYPLVADLRFDPAGNLWARRYDHLDAVAFFDYSAFSRTMAGPEFDEARTWLVFRPDGRWLGEVQTPPRFTVHEIGEGWILGVWQDEFDVSYVRRYPLVKPGS